MKHLKAVSLAITAMLVFGFAASPVRAATECSFGGPTPGWSAVRLDLPSGTPFLTLELAGQRAPRGPTDESNWHLAQGIFVIEASSLTLEAYRISASGMAPRTVALDSGDESMRQEVTAADVPYIHTGARLRDGLPPGSYYAIAFGTDGDRSLPNEWWSAGVQMEGSHVCTPIGEGEVFDYDHTDFTGGTQVYVPGVGHGQDLSLDVTTSRQLVIGLLEADTQAQEVSTISLDYQMPSLSGTLSKEMIPFVSAGGDLSFQASYTGYYPLVLAAGVSLDLP